MVWAEEKAVGRRPYDTGKTFKYSTQKRFEIDA